MPSSAQNVRFYRLVLTILITYYALFSEVFALYLLLGLSLFNFIFTHRYAPTAYLYRLLSLIGFDKIFSLNPRYQRSFEINRKMELFEEGMRLIFGGIVLVLHLYGFYGAATALAFFMAIFMMISTFFGFCLSGLMYIGYCSVLRKASSENE